MATPLVTGCAAVVRQYLRERLGENPSAALVKALLINGAEDLLGQYSPSEAPQIPNFAEGWGRVNLRASVAPDESLQVDVYDEDSELDTGEQAEFLATVGTPGPPLKVTLVWTDPAGESLVNDLDLIVRDAEGNERHGNVAPHSDQFDRVNNVEQVIWENAPAGEYEIVVRAVRAALHPQSFAVVARRGA